MAAVTSIILTAAALRYSVYAGNQARTRQKDALTEQRKAQQQAEAQVLSEQREQDQERARLNQKQPDVASLLATAQKPISSPTLLSGPTGVDPGLLTLGRPKLLGE